MKVTFTLRDEDATMSKRDVLDVIESAFFYGNNARIIVETDGRTPTGKPSLASMVLTVEPTVEIAS